MVYIDILICGYNYYQGYGSGGTGTFRQGARNSKACLFCESTGHLVKDCEKKKMAIGK